MEALPIETERLLLRQFAVEDAEDVFAIFRMSRQRWTAAATTPLMRWTTNTAA